MYFVVTHGLRDCCVKAFWICLLFTIGCGQPGSTHAGHSNSVDDVGTETEREHDSGLHDSALPELIDECEASYVENVSGTVLNFQRRPVSAAKAQVCVYTPTKDSICVGPVETDEQGRWAIALPDEFRCIVKGSSRVVGPNGVTVTDVCGFSTSTTSDLDLGNIVLTEGTHDWTKDDLTLTHERGIRLVFDNQETLDDVASDLRVALDLDVSNTCFGTRYGTSYRVAITPEGWADGITLSALPAGPFEDGDQVEIFLIGGLYSELPDGELLSQGDAWHFTTATVANGHIRVDQKLPFLGWLHVRGQSPTHQTH